MARNPNEALKLKHVLYCAGSGGGKTTAIHNLGLIPKHEPVVIFDTYGTYTKLGKRKVIQESNLTAFYQRLVHLRNLKRPFVLALVGQRSKQAFEFFNRAVWAVADGYKPLHVVYEELIRFVNSTAKADGQLGENYQGGRKFGLICHSLFQRGQEVPKTVLRGSPIKWVGKQDDLSDADYWCKKIDKSAPEIAALVDLEYFLKREGIGNVTKGKLKPIR